MDAELDHVTGGMGVGKCENTNLDMDFCINDNVQNVNCRSGEGTLYFAGKLLYQWRNWTARLSLTLQTGQPSVITVIGVAETTSTIPETTTAPESSSETSSTGTETIASVEATLSSSPKAETTAKEPAEESTTDLPPTDEAKESPNNNVHMIAGTVGGVALAAILAGAGWWFWRRRRLRRCKESLGLNKSGHPEPNVLHDTGNEWKVGKAYEEHVAGRHWERSVHEAPGDSWNSQVYEVPGTDANWKRPMQ